MSVDRSESIGDVLHFHEAAWRTTVTNLDQFATLRSKNAVMHCGAWKTGNRCPIVISLHLLVDVEGLRIKDFEPRSMEDLLERSDIGDATEGRLNPG